MAREKKPETHEWDTITMHDPESDEFKDHVARIRAELALKTGDEKSSMYRKNG